ncbi:MAG TPA: acetyl-CoA carboxylase biotin carboxylase subunit [Thermomicrobiaceae bacterium]|nr:acetyl-CoA carboxylase biotin carboxylase subunit [Thermomicrobiaceae bacterium]
MSEDAGLFRKVLVANRGEIALRVMRALRELGIPSVAVYGEGELEAPHVRYADEAYHIPSEAALPYLDIPALLAVAREAGADAIHPGYGFLAENPAFAAAVAEAGMTFIGPSPAAIAAMGDKVAARRVAQQAGVPLVPGTAEPVDLAGASAFAEEVGYPVAIKAAAGGGGRGFRVAWAPEELEGAYTGASGEAERYFGDARVYAERYLDHPRHVEIQVFADRHGHAVSLGERDCSVQRRHQKLIEESPSPAIDDEIRRGMGKTAVALARAVGYEGAGTVEFLFQDGEFYFLEMNTRIQVEHPVTELVTGMDLVAEQIRVAAGLPLSFGAVHLQGHAIEVRINAEDAARNFAPVPGTVTAYQPPAGLGVRVDGAAEPGYQILPQYDSLIAKLIVWGRDRAEALARLSRALQDFEVAGVPTTIPFHRAVIASPAFASGDYDTRLLDKHPALLELAPGAEAAAAPASNGRVPEEFLVEVGGKRFEVRLYASTEPVAARRAPRIELGQRSHGPAAQGAVTSPIQGTVLRVAVEAGQMVAAGDLICVVEAMKMENEIRSTVAGEVVRVDVQTGQTVQIGAPLVEIEPAG